MKSENISTRWTALYLRVHMLLEPETVLYFAPSLVDETKSYTLTFDATSQLLISSVAVTLDILPPCPPLRPSMDPVDADGSEVHTDPKELRKLRQQQLQQKFRKEMEEKMQHQKQHQAKSEEAEVPIGRGSSGGEGFTCWIIHRWKLRPQTQITSEDRSVCLCLANNTFLLWTSFKAVWGFIEPPAEGSTYWDSLWGEDSCLCSAVTVPPRSHLSSSPLQMTLMSGTSIWMGSRGAGCPPAGAPPSNGFRPSTPGNHQMQTRSKTPQRSPGQTTSPGPVARQRTGRGSDHTSVPEPVSRETRWSFRSRLAFL